MGNRDKRRKRFQKSSAPIHCPTTQEAQPTSIFIIRSSRHTTRCRFGRCWSWSSNSWVCPCCGITQKLSILIGKMMLEFRVSLSISFCEDQCEKHVIDEWDTVHDLFLAEETTGNRWFGLSHLWLPTGRRSRTPHALQILQSEFTDLYMIKGSFVRKLFSSCQPHS